MKLLIKNGYVLDPSSDMEGMYDVLIENGIIAAVEQSTYVNADTVIDACGKLVMPGFIDMHVHLREPGYEYKETIYSGTRAAARGGFTTICPMPNTNPVIDSKCMVEYLQMKAEKEAVVHIVPIGAVTKGQLGLELSDIKGMADAGIKALSEDGKSVMDTAVYLEGMKAARDAGILIMAHCEDKQLAGKGVINEGIKSQEFSLEGISNTTEDVIAARDVLLAKYARVPLHLCHCSTEDSVRIIYNAKQEGLPISAEVCPHHFTMTDEDIRIDHGNYKMNPPLRTKEDVKALKEALRDNIIEVIATDHAPHGEKEKNQSFREAPFGIVGLETAFALTMTELVDTGYLTLMQMVEKLSYNPAKILGIDKGSLGIGKPADVVIADKKIEYTIDADTFVSKGKNTPFHGRKVKGMVCMTIVDGDIVYMTDDMNQLTEKTGDKDA